MTEVLSDKLGYKILFKSGLIDDISSLFLDITKAAKVLVVSDENVFKLYGERVLKSFEGKLSAEIFVFPAGEASKTVTTYFNIVGKMAQFKMTRQDVVVALGGGVVGDIAGFAAATYMRGIDVVQVPTTLLSMIDSSIGGKTGVDLPDGKNLLGAFHNPVLVAVDPDTLKTLPYFELLNGLGEALKYGVLKGGKAWDILDGEIDYEDIIRQSVKIKADYVASDFKESGARKFLNLGHTYGHAIESLSDYQVPHGVAVVKGIVKVADIALSQGKLQEKEYQKIVGMAQKIGFDVSVKFSEQQLAEKILMDKKMNSDGNVSLIIPYGIGDCRIESQKIR